MVTDVYCWYCEEPISHSNNSKEHIIPQCIGGSFERKWILHRHCNRELNFLDDELEKQFHPQILLSEYKSKRNPNKIFKVYDSKFNVVNMINPSTIRFKLKMIIDKNKEINLEGNDESETLRMAKEKIIQLNNGKNKYHFEKFQNSLQYDNNESKLIYFSNGLAGDNPEQSKYGGPILERSIAKIALNFAISQNLKFNYENLKSYIISDPSKDAKDYSNIPVRFYNPSYLNIYFPCNEEISHIICLRGESESKLLLAYIEIFNFECFLVILDNNYQGVTTNFFIKQEINKIYEISKANCFTRDLRYYMRAFEEQNFYIPNVEQRLKDTVVRFERFMRITKNRIKQQQIRKQE